MKRVGLSQYLLAERPMERMCIDFLMTKLPESSEGHFFLLVVICCFTRFPVAIPLRTQTKEELSEVLLNQVFYVYGFPRIIHSDNARSLCNEALGLLFSKMGVSRTTIAVQNPKGNAPVERMMPFFHSVFTKTLPQYNRWHAVVPLVLFAYRVARHETTGYSPFFLMYGRDPILPLHLTLQSPLTVKEDVDISAKAKKGRKWVEDKLEAMIVVFQEVCERQKKVALRNQARLNEGRMSAHFFQIGDLVLLRRYDRTSTMCPAREVHETPSKDTPLKWRFGNSGPHEVVGFGDFETVKIRKADTQKVEFVLAAHLSLFNPFRADYGGARSLCLLGRRLSVLKNFKKRRWWFDILRLVSFVLSIFRSAMKSRIWWRSSLEMSRVKNGVLMTYISGTAIIFTKSGFVLFPCLFEFGILDGRTLDTSFTGKNGALHTFGTLRSPTNPLTSLSSLPNL